MNRADRARVFHSLGQCYFDVAVVGAGITGACIYHHLRQAGYRVLLIDQGDYAGGTSQASAMMIWGGLPYLRHGDLASVWRLVGARDELIRSQTTAVAAQTMRYLPDARGRSPSLIRAGLLFYWILGGLRRQRPRNVTRFAEQAFLGHSAASSGAISFEEGRVQPSDARYVLDWLLPLDDADSPAFNHCRIERGEFETTQRGSVRMTLVDVLLGGVVTTHARWVVNATGIGVEALDERLGLQAPYRHAMSKGVFIGLPRWPEHEVPLIFETPGQDDWMALIPWGPISLWGPTETLINSPAEGRHVQPEDVRFLLAQLNRHLAKPVTATDVVGLRCGIRQLAVRRGQAEPLNSLSLSRRPRVHCHTHRPWTSIFGGKLTDAALLARSVVALLRKRVVPSNRGAPRSAGPQPTAPMVNYPGTDLRVADPQWCAAREHCWRLEDYLRRRSNVAQWLPRGGLGSHDEHLGYLRTIALMLHEGDVTSAELDLERYRAQVHTGFDQVLAQC